MKKLLAVAGVSVLVLSLTSAVPAQAFSPTGYEVIADQSPNVTSDPYQFGVDCSSGKVPLGGGFSLTDFGSTEVKVVHSAPDQLVSPTGWDVQVNNPNNDTFNVAVYVICAS